MARGGGEFCLTIQLFEKAMKFGAEYREVDAAEAAAEASMIVLDTDIVSLGTGTGFGDKRKSSLAH